MDVPGFVDLLSQKDVKNLTAVDRRLRETINQSEYWKTQFAKRLMVSSRALPAAPRLSDLGQSCFQPSRHPDYYKGLTQSIALFEAISIYRQDYSISREEAVKLLELKRFLSDNAPEVNDLLSEISRQIKAAKNHHNENMDALYNATLDIIIENFSTAVIEGVSLGALSAVAAAMVESIPATLAAAASAGTIGVNLTLCLAAYRLVAVPVYHACGEVRHALQERRASLNQLAEQMSPEVYRRSLAILRQDNERRQS